MARNVPSLVITLCIALLGGCHPAEPAPRMATPNQEPPPQQVAQQATPPAATGEISLLSQNYRTPVIMYHDVIRRRGRGSMWYDITAAEFEAQLDWFQREGYTPISLDALYGSLVEGKTLPDKAVVLTFDDNYQGFYDLAYPLLKERNLPCAMFVHTGFVGSAEGRPKMTWDELKTLVKDGLVTIGSHTVTHPDDITLLSDDQQRHELQDSKQALESQLGVKIDYLAYPDGKNSQLTQAIAREVGYKMAFSTDHGSAQQSPNIMCVNRWVDTKYRLACQAAEGEKEAPASAAVYELRGGPIDYELTKNAGIDMAYIVGGMAASRRSPTRESVSDFLLESHGSAGVNGAFFAMAAISGTSNEMIGPVRTENEGYWVPDMNEQRRTKLANRPLIMWGPTRIAVVPFQGGFMNSEDEIKAFMPDYTDAFVAGAWLVHDGVGRTREQMRPFSSGDYMDPRKRVFFGVMRDGRPVAGASLGSVSAEKIAQAAAEFGVAEAVMLDCGFSTSLVYGDKIIASGHATPTEPSRPVPHAIVFMGQLTKDPALIAVPQPPKEKVYRKRKHAKKHEEAPADQQAPDATPPPDDGGAAPEPDNTPPDAPTNGDGGGQ